MSKFQIDLANYPRLLELFENDKKKFAETIKPLLENALSLRDTMTFLENYDKYDKTCRDVFNMSVLDLINQLVEAFFDFRGITSHHPNKEEGKLLEYLEHENNPLAIFSGYTVARDSKGEPIEKKKFIGSDTDFKNYFQGLLYAARYLNHEQLVNYLTLNRYDLVEGMKQDHFMQLQRIQPVLEFQKLYKLPVGKRKEGTAFFDCGVWENPICPITKQEMIEEKDGFYSPEALAYFSFR